MKTERKPEKKYSNRYKYIPDSEEENDSSNDESTTSEYLSDNPESNKKRKSKQIKTDKKNSSSKKLYQYRKNENRKRSHKNNFSSSKQQKNPILRQKMRPTYSGAVSNKPQNILIPSYIMLKTLRMREGNNHLEKGTAHLNSFPTSKAQQRNHHSIPILQEHKYDGAIINAGISHLIKNPNENKDTTKIVRDVIDIALQ